MVSWRAIVAKRWWWWARHGPPVRVGGGLTRTLSLLLGDCKGHPLLGLCLLEGSFLL